MAKISSGQTAKDSKAGKQPAKQAPKPKRQILSMALSALTLDPENARKHGEADLAAICKSLEQFGQQSPIVITAQNVVVKGNGTMMAAMKLGWKQIDAIRTELTGQQLKAYAIADNRTAELSEWDDERLLEILQSFETDADLLDACSFDQAAIDSLLSKLDTTGELSEEPGDSQYTNKIVAPIYTPKGEKPAVAEMLDRTKADELIAEIKASGLPPEVERFMIDAAERHVVFNFRQIAEFYCHADASLQNLMERSGLVIIDYEKAVENGFVHLTDRLGKLADSELEESDGDA